MKYFEMNDGITIPALGLGTFKIKDRKEIEVAIEAAIENGYEYFDTAAFYDNEDLIGQAFKNAPLKREEYKIATKVWPSMFGKDLTKKSIDKSLENLQTDYIDVIHLHWYGKYFDEAWEVFKDYKRQGIVKSIAVCNFTKEHMEELLKLGEKPTMDQLESSPLLQDDDLVSYLKDKNIIHQAWSPLARANSDLLKNKEIIKLGEKYNKTPAQITLRWHIERGTMVIPKSINPDRIKENISIFDFDLTKEDMEAIKSIDKNKRFSHAPDEKDWLDEIGRK
ncbi:MAG: aldo/keto reductase [Anaerococcus sp.]